MPIIRVGDDLIDDDTGEYAGPADTRLPNQLEDENDLLIFMKSLMEAESRLMARRSQLKTVIENCERMVKREEERVNWLKHRYELNAKAIAQSQLPRKKDGTYASKTFTCPWGRVSFRDVKPTIAIQDEDAALNWCKSNLPVAVKVVEKVLITPLKDEFLRGDEIPLDLPDFVTYVEGRQSVTFTTVDSKEDGDDS